MDKVILFLLKRKVILYLCTFLIVLTGIGALFSFHVELVPKTNLPWIEVNISGGALPPEEMVEKVTKKIEQELKSVAGIKNFSSKTGTGFSGISILAEDGEGEKVKQETQNIVNRLRNEFPKVVDTVTVTQTNLGDEDLIDYAMVGTDTQTMLTLLKTTIKDRIESVPGVKEVVISEDGFENKVAITFLPERLTAYRTTAADVVSQLQGANWKKAVGILENPGFDTVVMIDNSLKNVEEFKNILIKTPKGKVALEQLATVSDLRGSVKDAISMTEGNLFVQISVKRAAGSDLITTQKKVEEVVRQINNEAGGNYEMRVMFESVSFIKKAITNLSRDVVIGGILAILVLWVFLRNWRVTMVIATTLPLSILMTFIALKAAGYNIDMVVLISLSLSIGLIVDAAIVVLESIYHLREKGMQLKQAIVQGSKEVIAPVFASQLTLIIVFLPLVVADFEQWLKPILHTIAFTVTSTILASTIAAFLFVPIFSERFLQHDKQLQSPSEKGKNRIVSLFQRLLLVTLRHRILTLLVALAVFVGALGLFPLIKIGNGLNANENQIFATLTMPDGTSLEQARTAAVEAEKALRELSDVNQVFFTAKKETVELNITLVTKSQRTQEKEEFMQEVNGRLNAIDGVERTSLTFGFSGESAPIELQVAGEDLEVSRSVSTKVEEMLGSIPGVVNIRNDFEKGKEKVTLTPNQEAMSQLQVDSDSLDSQISMLLGEQSLSTISQNGIETSIVARFPETWVTHPDQLQHTMIRTETGAQVPLHELVDFHFSKSPITIKHEKGEQIITVSAELLGTDIGTAGRQINEKLGTVELPAGYKIEIAGDLKEQNNTFTQGIIVLVAVVSLIYVIMVAQFGRLSQPFIIMLSLPMALVGVILGFVITQRTFGEMAMIGLVMLVGIVVSNAILLIDRINLLRSRGMGLEEAIVQGTRDRVRPVIMTKLTAILGMLPMGLAVAEGAELEAPLATGVIAGLIFHTLVTLVLVPVLYSIFEGIREKRVARKKAHRIADL
ncbi:efflux RND transporter permease subunit [Brevibacillus porteri]|uniref:AcrB/AcrD/AcrF family protein n=1 Tax=Brevibacillus porteri TaxID=2126350 RepID=A0ABX5FW05_9BACL|nr:efflux RND transporter permease subunit [Brevibacillus porteri]MED1798604.1 efflux RND transporter permease subunit [Brevibacillus porteri]MED2131287.1 efflux RND transporter permease subunit [Brevibacillus porteri]MED2743843.1 efflux RND transporter permease subunit [Brevibacillus porteri]MED2813572.1 efflux RND transporter permease subunit [Brevibacillus porteri]MED2892936.1 efflux RND transporter permease subunit [Brevibacillus porteri]